VDPRAVRVATRLDDLHRLHRPRLSASQLRRRHVRSGRGPVRQHLRARGSVLRLLHFVHDYDHRLRRPLPVSMVHRRNKLDAAVQHVRRCLPLHTARS
jgi:hypothetical protein